MAFEQRIHQIDTHVAPWTRQGANTYPVASIGLMILSLALPLLELKPNRIGSGTPVWVWASLVHVPILMLLLLVALTMAAHQRTGGNGMQRLWLPYGTWFVAWVLLFATLVASAFFNMNSRMADWLLYRLSPSAGFWAALFGSMLAMRWARLLHAPPPLLRVAMGLGTVVATIIAWRAGLFDHFSPYLELRSQGTRFVAELGRHIALSFSAFALALVVGILGAVLLSRGTRAGRLLGLLAGALQNVPSLALFGLLLPIMAGLADALPILRLAGISGIGFAPAFIALTVYALLPVMLAGAAGLLMVDAGIRDAAKGMGMSRMQVLFRVELPLALPSIAAGARTALVQTIGTTTIAALIGAGGLGYFVFQGIGQAAMDMVVIGVIPIVVLSVLADRLMIRVERYVLSKGGAPWR